MKYEKLPLHSYLKNQVLQFSVTLQGIEPKIWRRIHVPSDYNFWDLHVAIQDAMGWQDWDPKRFEPDKVRFDNPYKRWQYAFLNK